MNSENKENGRGTRDHSRDRSRTGLAWITSILVHGILFLLVLPGGGSAGGQGIRLIEVGMVEMPGSPATVRQPSSAPAQSRTVAQAATPSTQKTSEPAKPNPEPAKTVQAAQKPAEMTNKTVEESSQPPVQKPEPVEENPAPAQTEKTAIAETVKKPEPPQQPQQTAVVKPEPEAAPVDQPASSAADRPGETGDTETVSTENSQGDAAQTQAVSTEASTGEVPAQEPTPQAGDQAQKPGVGEGQGSGEGPGQNAGFGSGEGFVLDRPVSYPKNAQNEGIEGEVLLAIFLNPNGHVAAEILSSSGNSGLDTYSLRAVTEKWKYKKPEDNMLLRVRLTFKGSSVSVSYEGCEAAGGEAGTG